MTKKPFFARYLETQDLEKAQGGRTTKYPSDRDEISNSRTLKYPSDADEFKP